MQPSKFLPILSLSTVVPFPGSALSPHAAFCQARQDMLRALADWLRCHPDPESVRLEADGTAAALRQLAEIGGGHV